MAKSIDVRGAASTRTPDAWHAKRMPMQYATLALYSTANSKLVMKDGRQPRVHIKGHR